MPRPRRADWRAMFADVDALRAVLAAAREAMTDGCGEEDEKHDPEVCGCETNLVTPLEFVDWIALHVQVSGRPVPLRQDHHENLKGGALLRWNQLKILADAG